MTPSQASAEQIVTRADVQAAGKEFEDPEGSPPRMRPDLPVTIYTPESPLQDPLKLLRSMMQDLLVSRELAWRLFVRDTRARYRDSLLGYFWLFTPPLVASLPFIFLNAQGVIKIGDTPLPYGAYAIVGTMIWQVFVDALNSPLQAVSGAKHLLT